MENIEYFGFSRYYTGMSRPDEVMALFNSGLNCAQALLAVYGKGLGIDYAAALRLGNAFGGGIAKTGETCGSVTGALMVISLRYGASEIGDRVSREKAYALAAGFLRSFEERNGSVVCRELIGFDINSRDSLQKNSVISERCPRFVRDAAEILEEMISESHNSQGTE